jgi:hypothetical protein
MRHQSRAIGPAIAEHPGAPVYGLKDPLPDEGRVNYPRLISRQDPDPYLRFGIVVSASEKFLINVQNIDKHSGLRVLWLLANRATENPWMSLTHRLVFALIQKNCSKVHGKGPASD